MDIQETGFVPGKGSARDYTPAWMKLPGLYTTEKATEPLAVIKLFTPDSSWTWFLTEYDGQGLAFGLVVGLETELGFFSLDELRGVRGRLGLRVERDLWFRPTPITRLPEYVDKWGAHGPYPGSPPVNTETTPLPDGWQPEDIRFLLERLGEGPLLVADTRLGIPTIHDWKGAEHLGFGLFRVEVENATLHFDGGGAMARTPSGKGWCPLQIVGHYAFDFEAVRATLDAYLDSGPSGDDQGIILAGELPPPFPTEPVPHRASWKANPGASECESRGDDRVSSPLPRASASDPAWTPSSADVAEFQTLENDLLQGDLSRGGNGYLALLTAERPGTLRLALDEIGADTARKRLTKKRLQQILRG